MSRPSDVVDQALGLGGIVGADRTLATGVCVRVPGGGRLGVLGRLASPRDDGRSPLSELAVMLVALRPDAAAMVMPARVRDTVSGEVLSRGTMAVGIDTTGGGNRMDAVAQSWGVADGELVAGARVRVDVRGAPTASLLHDAVVRSRIDLPPVAVGLVLQGWGHHVVVDVREPLPVDHPLNAGVPPGTSPARARHLVDRLARELERRHRPNAPVGRRRGRPGVPYDLPAGWAPACPV